ncbi:MAG TPA: TonB-dependent receptor plug domain-containing protein [Lacunisphaera sp.]|nr:TonB-dependent receptor plug domain-containing protein [Lacunisphaera sp.]
MNRYRLFRSSVLALCSALSVGPMWAQTAADTPAGSSSSATSREEDVIVLDPFTVTTDHEGYKADDTLAGGRVRTQLRDTPSSLSVVTKKFLTDLNINNQEDLFVYTNNTEIAGLYGNYSGMSTRGQGIAGGAEATRLTNPAGVNRGRGLTAMDGTRNYFPSDIPWDGYNISRVDISRGPNSFLFGTGSPSGISNVSTNEATFRDGGSFDVHIGSYGTTRESLDFNKVLVPGQATIRLDLVNDNRKFEQEPAFNHSQRAYGAIRVDPKFFRTDSAYTKIQASFEHGKVLSNNPRTLPPMDYLSGYLGDPDASKTGYNPWLYNQDENVGPDPRYSLWAGAGSLANQYQWANDAQLYYDAMTGALLDGGQAGYTTPTGNGYGAEPNTWNVHTVGYYSMARASNYYYRQAHNNQDGGPFAGAYRGTVRYFDKSLSDPSIFDFYNQLIDGDNKREWQRWNTYNVSIVQSLFHDRLVLQGVVDHQEYLNGNAGILSNPWLVLDLNSYNLKTPTWLPGATTNPNLGRPLVFGNQGNHNINRTERDNYQMTAAYTLDLERDLGMRGFWGRLLGKQDLTALAGSYDKFEEHRNYKLYGIDPSYKVYNGDKTSAQVLQTDNGFNWLAYVGPSLLGKSAAGANLSNLATSLSLPSSYSYTVFSKDWTAGSSVNPSDPWTFTGGMNGATMTQTQADNPANYRGYTRVSVPMIADGRPRDVLATGGTQRRQKITSTALLYQGHFWDDTIIPSFGYRRDKTFQQGSDASRHRDTKTGIYDLNYHIDIDDPTGIEATTTSKSYGVAVHLPKSLKKNLPEGTDVSLYYFHGSNQTPRVRYAIDGSQLPNESGETDDYSVQFDGFSGRLTARLTYFKTLNSNSSASVGQPLGTFMVRALPEWTLMLHAYSMAHRALPKDADGYYILPSSKWDSWTRESWANWPYTWMDQHPAEAAKANADMMTKFTELYPQSYWDNYGYHVDVEAIKRGDWAHVVQGTDFPYFPPQLGGGDTVHGEYPTIDQNLMSKGFEFEMTFRPVKNWDITFNASKVDATQVGLGAAATKQLTGMADLFLGSGVQYAGIWGGYEGAKNSFLSDIWAPYLTQVALIGGDQPEMRKYKFNLISNYRFTRERFKGLEVGGAWRWEDRAILGYGIHETTIYGEKAWIADVNQPIYGPTDSHFDAWVGYQHKLSDKLDWRVQFNVRSLGESTHLVKAAVEPDGNVAQSRIVSGATYDFSMKFSF